MQMRDFIHKNKIVVSHEHKGQVNQSNSSLDQLPGHAKRVLADKTRQTSQSPKITINNKTLSNMNFNKRFGEK